jgi:hypothetical protein
MERNAALDEHGDEQRHEKNAGYREAIRDIHARSSDRDRLWKS